VIPSGLKILLMLFKLFYTVGYYKEKGCSVLEPAKISFIRVEKLSNNFSGNSAQYPVLII
jgi:hypothetical protein